MKLLLISCGGTIVSPAAEGGVKAGEIATEAAVKKLIRTILPLEMLAELNRRATEDLAASPNVSRCFIELDPESDDPGGRLKDKKPLTRKNPPLDVKILFDVDSTEVCPAHWGRVINCIIENYDDYDGFIVTHGTNTLAYTASALTFGLPHLGKPVVMTGANLPLGLPFSDAALNASYALLLVQKLISEGHGGVVAVFVSHVMPGPRVKKASGTEFEAFRTFNAADIGQMRPKEVLLYESEFEKYVTNNDADSEWPGKVCAKDKKELRATSHTDFRAMISSHTFHPGDDPEPYLAVIKMLETERIENGLRGALIIRAVGDGDVSKLIQEKVFSKAKEFKIPIVVTTQEPGGTSSLTGNKQSEGVVEKFGVIPALDMSIETMVVKLRYLLAKGLTYEQIQKEFIKSYHGEIRKR